MLRGQWQQKQLKRPKNECGDEKKKKIIIKWPIKLGRKKIIGTARHR